MVGYRETTLFLYRYWQCCFLNDEKEALRHTLDFNAMFAEPLTEREVVNATRSAQKAWEAKNDKEADRIAREKGYPGAGYNVGNKKLIEWLDITEDEQQHLKTIIGWREKRKRDRGYQEREKRRKETERREAGMMLRQDYLEKAEERCQLAWELHEQGLRQKEIADELELERSTVSKQLSNQPDLSQKEERYQKALELRGHGMTQKEIAEALGVSQSTVSRLLKTRT